MEDNFDKTTVTVKPDDVILLRYHSDIDPENVQISVDALKDEFPDNKVLAITDDMDLLVANPEQAIDLLERMIGHIKVTAYTKPKIILS